MEVIREDINCLPPREPCLHLHDIVLSIRGGVCVFSEVYVKPFGRLSVETVCRSMRANHMDVMLHRMDLRNVEMRPNLELDERVLVCMEAVPRVFEPLKGVVGVCLKVSVVYEIEGGTSRLHNFWVSRIGNDTKKDLLHVLVLISSPLGDEGYPFLEMTKAWVPGHCLETAINFALSTNECLSDPLDQVILEDTLVELMKDIGGEGCEDITEGEVFPKRIDGS